MVCHCRPSKLSFGGVSPTVVPISKPRNAQVSIRAVFSSVDGPRWNYNLHCDASTRFDPNSGAVTKKEKKEEEEEEEEEEEQRKVHCEVEVVSWRERRVKAETFVEADVDSVWSALTDYERLADFVPNLVSSGLIQCPYPGRIWLEQRGFQRALYWHIQARVVLDLQEFIHSDYDRELHFSMVDGDFIKFQGKWFVKCGTRSSTSILSYEVNVIPRFNFPAIFLERIIRSDLPVNLRALACRAERSLEGNHSTVIAETSSLDKTRGSVGSVADIVDGVFKGMDNLCMSELKEDFPMSNVGRFEPNFNLGKSCSLDKQRMADEVHLRRFDGLLENGGVHRFVVACITVKAPVREVWSVLTAYEILPEIVPHMAISKVLSRENNRVRILQEGCKGLLYMVLHARAVLELCEVHEREIRFEQVEGDFDSLKGKWVLEQLGCHHTRLKYSVESKMHRDTFLSEAMMEEVIYEDLPSNLCAIRDYVEKRREQEEEPTGSDTELQVSPKRVECRENGQRQRPRVPGLRQDIEILKGEVLKFISEHGEEGFMPMRKQLRSAGRVDIEKAITRMGGFRRIASVMSLSLAYKDRKPKGYWDSLDNLREEIRGFQRSWGMDASYMPSRKTLERAGRYDIARALEKWGGLHQVSRLLSLKPRRLRPNRRAVVAPSEQRTTKTKANSNTCSNSIHSQNYLHPLDIRWVD